MTSKRVYKQWLDFDHNVIPRHAPAVQRQEMKRAFYAGAFMLLEHLKANLDDDLPEEQGVDILESISQECVEFMERGGR
jgi:hypothetical protein